MVQIWPGLTAACLHTISPCHIWTTLYIKVKCSRYRSGVAQRVRRGIALLFHDRGTRTGWVVSSTLRPHFTPGKDPVPIVQEAGWAPGSVLTGWKSRPHRDSIPDRPARSELLYRLSYPAHIYNSFRSIFFQQVEFSTQCDLVLSLSISSILSFAEHQVTAYVFFLVFLSLVPFRVSVSITCFGTQLLRHMWPIQLAFLVFVIRKIFLYPEEWTPTRCHLLFYCIIGSTCFGHYYAYHQELATIMLITMLVVSFLICCMLEVRCS